MLSDCNFKFNWNDCNCDRKWVAVAIGAIPVLYLVRRYFQGGQFRKNISAEGKIVIITGANTGIGKETALDLARRGAKVYMACRDTDRCEVARLDIIAKTGNTNVINCKLNLASLASVREFVKIFLQQEKRLDILINNAGVVCNQRMLTSDGFEMTIGVNHFAPFLLTNLLLDTLKASGPSRIVNVTGKIYESAYIHKQDLHAEKSYSGIFAYSQSKLANILFTRELANRLKGTQVTANVLHPGVIRTELLRDLPLPLRFINIFFLPIMKTVKSGAQTTLAVALDPDFKNVSGKYFSDCKIAKEGPLAKDDEMAKWLWMISEECTK